MKILFVDNLLLKQENSIREMELQPHLGLISLIAVLRKEGYDAGLYDPKLAIARGDLHIDEDLYRHIATALLLQEPDVLGFTSLGCNFICTLKIAGYVRRQRPALPILLGGPHATVLHREIMTAFTEFDVIVRNEAEGKIVAVVRALPGVGPTKAGLSTGALHQIEGVTFRDNDTIIATSGATTIKDLSTLPFPAYDAYPIPRLHLRKLRVEAGRGCPFSCTFCSTASFFGRSYRLKPAAALIAELDYLSSTYGIREFGLSHDLFTVNAAKVLEFCREVTPKKYKWSCSARMDCVDKQLLTAMKKAGCTSIFYGIETGSREMQRISKKKLDLSLFHDTLRNTLRLGIKPTLSFIAGYPEETKQHLDDTLDLIAACYGHRSKIEINLQLHLLTPEPGTALIMEHKDKLRYDNYITDFNFPTLEEDDPEIMQRNPDIFMNHHYYASILPRRMYIMTTSLFGALRPLGSSVMRYLLGFYHGSLAALNDEVYAWADTNSITIDVFLRYLAERFGAGSLMLSLAKWRYEIDRLKGRLFMGELRTVFSTLENIHACPELLEMLDEGKKIPRRLLDRREDLIIEVRQNSHGQCKVETCYIGEKTFS